MQIKGDFRLIKCRCKSLFNCHQCSDMGEYWLTSAGGKLFIGDIRKRANLARKSVLSQRDRDNLLTSTQ